MSNKIIGINTEYFGDNRNRNYLKDDFSKALRGTILRSILINIFVELDKKRRNEKELPDGGKAFGDFDPDNAGFFANIFSTYQKGWMVDIRILLGGNKRKKRTNWLSGIKKIFIVNRHSNKDREAGSGGRFIDDIAKLTSEDFIGYYVNQDESIITPPFLFQKLIKEKPSDGADFIKKNRNSIDESVKQLVDKAKKFQSKGYFNKIMKDYESLEFHKDNRPEKYNLRAEPTEFPFANGTMTVRSPKATIAIKEIATCLNDFAEIITIYQSLVGKNTSFITSNWPLDIYIDRTFSLFSKNISENVREKTAQDVIKYLHQSIDLVQWDHKKINQTQPPKQRK